MPFADINIHMISSNQTIKWHSHTDSDIDGLLIHWSLIRLSRSRSSLLPETVDKVIFLTHNMKSAEGKPHSLPLPSCFCNYVCIHRAAHLCKLPLAVSCLCERKAASSVLSPVSDASWRVAAARFSVTCSCVGLKWELTLWSTLFISFARRRMGLICGL